MAYEYLHLYMWLCSGARRLQLIAEGTRCRPSAICSRQSAVGARIGSHSQAQLRVALSIGAPSRRRGGAPQLTLDHATLIVNDDSARLPFAVEADSPVSGLRPRLARSHLLGDMGEPTRLLPSGRLWVSQESLGASVYLCVYCCVLRCVVPTLRDRGKQICRVFPTRWTDGWIVMRSDGLLKCCCCCCWLISSGLTVSQRWGAVGDRQGADHRDSWG